jgi:RNA polymerase sigma-70 factor (ECF subfamily)
VLEAIEELTPDHKAVILLRELEGLSYEEISRVMQCSKGTVMSRLHYARKKLQARLKEFV